VSTEQQEALRQILAELERLEKVARHEGKVMLGYLIEMAANEARDQIKKLAS